MKKIVSFSLWGDIPMYNAGAVSNAKLLPLIYPGWDMIVYYDNTVPADTISELKTLNVTLCNMTEKNISPAFWRYYIIDNKDYNYCIFRDCDSRVSEREAKLVNDWIQSKKILHVIRDHPGQKIAYGSFAKSILAGMWGIDTNNIQYSMTEKLNQCTADKYSAYGEDQRFLHQFYIHYNKINEICEHDFCDVCDRSNPRFIGERIDHNEQPLTDDWKAISR